MALHPHQNSCSLIYHLVILFGSFSISASCKFDQFKTNSARSKFGLSIVPLVSNKFGLLQIRLVSNSACFKFRLSHIWLAPNSACFKFGLFISLVYFACEPRMTRIICNRCNHLLFGQFGQRFGPTHSPIIIWVIASKKYT